VETITSIKRQTTEWEKIFISYSMHEGLTSRIYKELKKLNTKEEIILLINEQMS
jgi:hypothetical protein